MRDRVGACLAVALIALPGPFQAALNPIPEERRAEAVKLLQRLILRARVPVAVDGVLSLATVSAADRALAAQPLIAALYARALARAGLTGFGNGEAGRWD
jgi:lysozyme family protein